MQSLLKNKINFVLTPSLEHRALANIAITLWSLDDVKNSMTKSLRLMEDSWKEIEVVVIEKLSKLPLPEKHKEKLLSFIAPVGLQILSWIDFHQHRNSFSTEFPATLFWTSLGTIDNKRTAEGLVKDGSLSVHERFKLACIYCLEDEIRDLWETFGLYERGHTRPTRSAPSLVSFWSIYLEEDWNQLRIHASNLNPYEYALKESAKSGNEAATRYFFQKLYSEDDHFTLKIARHVASVVVHECGYISKVRYSGVLLFLLSTMDAQQQSELFKTDTYAVLNCLLVWPWQSLFLETAKANWDFLSESDYNGLLVCIVGSMDYKHNLHKHFEEFWQLSPETCKQFVTNGDSFGYLLQDLYEKDEKNAQLILKDSSISAKKALIFGERGQNICEYLVSFEKWDSVKFLIQECITSREEMIKFRDGSKIWITSFYLGNEFPEESRWNKFFQLVEDCILTYN